MPVRHYANAPASSLAKTCTALTTSITLTSVSGLPISYPYTLIIDRGLPTEEAVSVTAAAGTTLTVTRGIDGTTAFAHTQDASVVHGITAQDIREANAHINANTGVHGIPGALVGTTEVQTLTKKTIDLTDNTVRGTRAEFNTALEDDDFTTGSSVRRTSSLVVNNTTTYAPDPQLVRPVVANATYLVILSSNVTFASGTAGARVGLSGPTDCVWVSLGTTGTATVRAFGGTGSGTAGTGRGLDTLVLRTVSAGNVSAQLAQANAEPNNTSLDADSTLILLRVA